MAGFTGFPARVDYTPVPSPLLGPLLEEFTELAQLQCALRLLFLLHRKKGALRYVTFSELAADAPLLRALSRAGGGPPQETLRKALDACLERGLFLSLPVQDGERREELLLLNTPANRQAAERIRRGEQAVPELPHAHPLEEPPHRPDIFRLYEENIGVITPLIAEELKDAEATYPASWIEAAFREAVQRNKRHWRYIAAILRRWAQEGLQHGEPAGYPQKVAAQELFRRGRRYGPLAR